MTKFLETVHSLVWGVPALVLIIGVGAYLTVRTGFVQIGMLPQAIRHFLRQILPGKADEGGISGFRALCTALGATVGTGNLVGVAGALCIGGPGSIFWMWICGILGMATKYAEATLAVRYRVRSGGEYLGGPMYMISRGLDRRFSWLAWVYSFLGVVAAFGVGNATQINAVVGGINSVLTLWGQETSRAGNLLLGVFLALLVGLTVSGGAGRIGSAAEKLVPLVSALYIGMCVGVLFLRAEQIPGAFRAIVQGAFCPRAVTGGMIGSAVRALRVGCARGVFTNEAGMGTASIAHASAHTDHPCRQGLMGIIEVFLDTIVICTLTALVILCSGVRVPYGVDAGGTLTAEAFCLVWGDWAAVFLAGALCCLAFATVLGWGLYGARCAQFLFGAGAWNWFCLLQAAAVILGAVGQTNVIWMAAEIVNGLMAIPNLIALTVLTPELVMLTKEFKGLCRA